MKKYFGLVLCVLYFSVAGAQSGSAIVFSQNAEANELFVRARALYAASDPRTGGKLANAKTAIKLYEEAIGKDPGFALAYTELSRSWLRLGYSDPDGLPPAEILPPARAAALKAVELDPRDPEAHVALAALAYTADFDWKTAEREYRKALELDSANAGTHTAFAGYLSSMGRFPEALSEAAKAEALGSSLGTDLALARIYYSMRRYDIAAEYCKKALARQDNVLGHFFLGLDRVAQGHAVEAIPELEAAAAATHNGGAMAGLAYVYAMAGHADRAQELLDKLFAGQAVGLVVPYRVAAVYVALGNKDQAFRWLDQSYQDHDNWMNQLRVDPVMDPLRSDVRFKTLMKKLHF